MTQVRVWLLNEGGRWFRYWPLFEAPADRQVALRAIREHVRLLLQDVRSRTGFRPLAVAYEVVCENG
jgi:hypothetical protein